MLFTCLTILSDVFKMTLVTKILFFSSTMNTVWPDVRVQ